jgi:hypothetical protein
MVPRLVLDLAVWSPEAKVGSPDLRGPVSRLAALEYDVGVFDSGGFGFDSGAESDWGTVWWWRKASMVSPEDISRVRAVSWGPARVPS